MRAIGETALRRQRSDFVEDFLNTPLPRPKLQFAHAGRIDERAANGQRRQLAMRTGVPAAAVGLAHRAGEEALCAEQPVDDGRLPNA